MLRGLRIAAACSIVVALSLSACHSSGAPAPVAVGPKAPKNVIILIADGAGFKQIEAANLYQLGRPAGQVYERFPVRLAMSTYPVGKGYDPALAWSDPAYIKKNATDSAAAATAMACGVKTYNGAIGVDSDKRPLKNLMQAAEECGKATGVVTSVGFSHATPAGFVAHNDGRGHYTAIAQEMLEASATDVIMGTGHPCYDNAGAKKTCKDANGEKASDGCNYTYISEALWNALREGKAGLSVDADHNGALDDPWTLVDTRQGFQALMKGPTPKRVMGLAPIHTTLQQKRPGDTKTAYAAPVVESAPTLAEMARAAINVLDDDPDGFVLMIEGGAVDTACHSNEAGRMIEEMISFNEAAAAVVAWVETQSSWDETLVIVTGDHETGYLSAPSEGGPAALSAPLVNQSQGRMPGVQFNSKSHTNSLLPFYAKGPQAQRFQDRARESDPVRGPCIDNTVIGQVVIEWMSASAAPSRSGQ